MATKPRNKPAAKTSRTPTASPPENRVPSADAPPTEATQTAPDAALAAVAAVAVAASSAPKTPATPPEKTKECEKVMALIVSAKIEGFRRAGRAWSRSAETVSTNDLTLEQIEALLSEPMLDVVMVAA